MPRLAANLSLPFPQLEFRRHFAAAGEIISPFLLAHLDRIGYRGWIGCEYNPVGDTPEGLKWAKPYL